MKKKRMRLHVDFCGWLWLGLQGLCQYAMCVHSRKPTWNMVNPKDLPGRWVRVKLVEAET